MFIYNVKKKKVKKRKEPLPKYSPVSICTATITSNEIPGRKKITYKETNIPLKYFKLCSNVQFQKISILPLQRGMEFPGGWGVL